MLPHVEAHESASDPWPSGGAGAADPIYTQRASDGVSEPAAPPGQ